jgi:hypothetical protein
METIKIKSLYSGELHRYFEKDDNIIRCGNVVLSVNEPVELQIEGCINSFDIIFLRSLCGGGTSFRINRMPAYVKILNLLNVTFESDDTPYFETHSDFRSAVYGTKPKTITSYMFAKLKGVEEIILPSDTIAIERCAFYDCSARSVIVPNCTEILDTNSFERSHIESISVNAVAIKNGSFENCNLLKSIAFGKDVKHINGAFGFHGELDSIEISPDNC